jgi:hypothetical protein
MHAEVISEMVTRFIGVFDTLIEEARLRQNLQSGDYKDQPPMKQTDAEASEKAPGSDLALTDYTPHLHYTPDLPEQAESPVAVEIGISGPEFDMPSFHLHYSVPAQLHDTAYVESTPTLPLYPGADQAIAHIVQANATNDDDFVDLTGTVEEGRDTSYVLGELGQMHVTALSSSPFADFVRTDTPSELVKTYDAVHNFATQLKETVQGDEQANPLPLQGLQVAVASDEIQGTYVNGALVEDVAKLEEVKPDALQPYIYDPAGNSNAGTEIQAGGNLLTNVAVGLETGVLSHVSAVMGNYYHINAITQSYVYSDQDTVTGSDGVSRPGSTTVAMNIATFAQEQVPQNERTTTDEDGSPIFPTAWKVSVMQGDVVFLHWVEQHNFVTDSDTITVFAQGDNISLITGNNTALNISSFADLGSNFDFVITGGNVYDMNIISQLSVLYDDDMVNGQGYGQVSTSGNLIWNQATIDNVGQTAGFQALPDYVYDVTNNINNLVDQIPEGLSYDPNFAGYQGLNVLYITGNLFQVNYIMQENSLGDADQANTVAQGLSDQGADVLVTTGSNTLANIASIIDYNSIGETNYVGGGVYSDSVLIQSGLVQSSTPDHDGTDSAQLVSEVIAFLDDGHAADTGHVDSVSAIQPDHLITHSADAMVGVMA